MSIICIEIKKYKETTEKIYYKINDVYNKDSFFASIEPQKKIIKFYDLDNLEVPVKTIDYADEGKPLGTIKGHSQQAMIRAFINLFKAAKLNQFADDLSYCA